MEDMIAAMGAGGVQNAWQGAGKALMGASNRTGYQDAYYKGADNSLSLLKKQFEAREARDKEVARQKTYGSLVSAGMDPAQAEAATNLAVGELGTQFAGGMRGMETMQNMGLQKQAAGESDPNVANQLLSALRGAPNDLTKISAGTAYNPTVTPDAQTMALTPDAAADNMRQAMVADSQVYRNVATGDAATTRAVSSSGKPERDMVAEHARKKRVDEIFNRYEDELDSVVDPALRAAKEQERDAEIAAVTEGSIEKEVSVDPIDAAAAAGAWAESMKQQFGNAPSAPQMEAARARFLRGEPLLVQPLPEVNDGTRPPQVIEPSTGKPVTGGPGDKPGNSPAKQMKSALTDAERKAGLPPRLDYVGGGITDQAPGARPGAQTARPRNAAEYNALPSGAMFIDPGDGKLYRKP